PSAFSLRVESGSSLPLSRPGACFRPFRGFLLRASSSWRTQSGGKTPHSKALRACSGSPE
ncbi:MAG: hypothetical protein ACRD3T_19820, partial [Terriglobia bacterium]